MPLISGKSKKAFGKNVAEEMDSGKSQPQSLAIAYSVKRKAKKMADGGAVPQDAFDEQKQRMLDEQDEKDADNEMIDAGPGSSIDKSKMHRYAKGGEVSANNESRPMPESEYDDSSSISRNNKKKSLPDDQWTDEPTVRQAQKPSLTMLKHPSIKGSDAFSVRISSMRDEEDDLESSKAPGSPGAQPMARDDEESPDRQGPEISDMSDEHSNGRKPYAKGGMIDLKDDESDLEDAASPGGDVSEKYDSPDQMQSSGDPDMDDEHSNGRKPYAKGGEVDMEPHPKSVADAIMRKKAKMMADGGMVDLEANSREDKNNEDDESYEALLKEQYDDSQLSEQPADSNEHGHALSDEDDHNRSLIDKIRSLMKSKGKL